MSASRTVSLLLLLALWSPGCSGGKTGQGSEATAVSPGRVLNDDHRRLVITGSGLRKAKRVLLWAGTAEKLQRAISLQQLRADSDTRMTARVPAGALPGSYRIVTQDVSATTFSRVTLQVEEQGEDTGPARVRGSEGALYSDVPSRVYLVGSNLRDVRAVELRQSGRAVALGRIKHYSAARLGATLKPGAAAPGTYRLRLRNGHGWADGPEVRVSRSGFLREAGLTFGIYFGVLGSIFVVGFLLAAAQGDLSIRKGQGRRNAVMLLGGFLFYLMLLGATQFVLSYWS